MIIPLPGFTYLYFIYIGFNLGRRTSTEVSQGVDLREGLPLKCSCTFFGNNSHDSNVLGKKFLISTYSEYIFYEYNMQLFNIYYKIILESFQTF